MTVSVIPLPDRAVEEFGILKFDEKMKITAFKEKPSSKTELRKLSMPQDLKKKLGLYKNQAYFASMGVYVFKARALMDVLESTDDMDFGKQVIPHAIDKLKSYGFIFTGYWRDIGTIRTFYEENIALTQKEPQFDFFSEDKRVFTHPRFLPPARIEDSAISASLITEGCVINGAKIESSVIGLRSTVKDGAVIKKSIIMGADFYEETEASRNIVPVGIGEGSMIYGAIIDKNARVGKNVTIKNYKNIRNFDSENYYIRDGIVIVPKNAVIPDNTKI